MTNKLEELKRLNEELKKINKKFPDWYIISVNKEDKVKDLVDRFIKNKQTKEIKIKWKHK